MKKWIPITAILLATSLYFIAGCSGEDRGSSVDLGKEKSELKTDLQQARDQINQRIDKINAEMQVATDDVKSDLDAEKSRLEELKSDLNESLQDLENQTEQTWKKFKNGANEAMVSVKAELNLEPDDDTSGDS